MYIHSLGSYHSCGKSDTVLKDILYQETGQRFRRIDRFIQLSLLGAHRAVEHLSKKCNPETGMYLTSGQGDIGVFQRLSTQKYKHKQLPKPVDFIHSLSNAAGFYVATHLGFTGKNLFLGHACHPFENALLMAHCDLAQKRVPALLLGALDEILDPIEDFSSFYGVPEGYTLSEGSTWFYLNNEREQALAEITPHLNWQAPLITASKQALTHLSFSAHLSSEFKTQVRQRYPLAVPIEIPLLNEKSYYETISARIAYEYCMSAPARSHLLHISGTDTDNAAFTLLKEA